MDQKKIILIPVDNNPITLDLHSQPVSEQILDIDYNKFKSVFSDKEYRFTFENIDFNEVEDISIFINGDKEEILKIEDNFCFVSNTFRNYYVFKNRYGFVELSIDIVYTDGSTDSLYSDYLSVLVHRDQELESIDKMVEYLSSRQDNLLINAEIESISRGDIKSGRFINLDTKISLAEELLKVYKDNFGYFSANSRFKTEVVDCIDDSNKLQSITPKTLQYIATHPNYLKEGNFGGIRVGGKNYTPNKTLIQRNEYSVNIYENQVVVGFLKKMIADIRSMMADVNSLINKQSLSNETSGDYIHSSYFIFRRSEKTLKDCNIRLKKLEREFSILINLYNKALDVDDISVNQMPMPSATFLSVAQYNNIYNHIKRWFEYGIYNLEQERFMMSFVSGSSLYEIYILAKFIENIVNSGYALEKQFRYTYRVSNGSYYNNTLCNNTFVFQGENGKLTLYFQPVIYNSRNRATNGINLYRNNTVSLNGVGSYYYTPDYVIKYESDDNEEYVIIDAKFADRNYVRNTQISSLAFKYLFSLSPRGEERIKGLYISYGRSNENNTYENVYDCEIDSNPISPFYYLIPITAGVNNDTHNKYLSRMLNSLIFD